ncbi:hypothetical protein A2738_03030 [Candidatus Nomurabacteria bacterium RIFCSPHIGHO2_01_FULL_42_15]|uniref:Uncharacterized protein n=1 Tax=Candidatus Nomurabacteria bacterium RIFCSPHIGHO2_01_FULL_42_15 TaxID=1801742 RepID=A0A1F6VES3_9BACT|nr:MAG: hypothetical protein A2738_03030 [Candidatus Nomurabacteria bacterium RIFCSPHIGHO2_01_FULL_42_15]
MHSAEMDLTALVYQPVSDWLKAVESKHNKSVADRCLAIVEQLGGNTNTMVSDLGRDRLDIINEASQT